MSQLDMFKALSEEFGDKIALAVLQVVTINLTLKIKDSEWSNAGQREKRITKRAKKLLWEFNDEEFNLIMALWDVSHDWDVSQTLQGLGGCKVKTFMELLDDKK